MVRVTLRVEGTLPPPVPLVADSKPVRQVDGYTIALDTGGPVYAGREAALAYTISRRGSPVTDLEPYLGAMGHLVAISRDLEHFVHSHPLGEKHDEGGHRPHDGHGSGEHGQHGQHGGVAAGSSCSLVAFHARFPEPGVYKTWAQFKHLGRILTVPFVLDVKPAAHQGAAHEDDHHH